MCWLPSGAVKNQVPVKSVIPPVESSADTVQSMPRRGNFHYNEILSCRKMHTVTLARRLQAST